MTTEEKEKAKEILTRLRNSCLEGLTQLWDCSTDEGRESFGPMANECEDLAKMLDIELEPFNWPEEEDELEDTDEFNPPSIL